MSRNALVTLFIVLLAAFTGIVKLVDFLAAGQPVPLAITDMRFPLFWAGIGTWAVYATKKRANENADR